MQSLPKLKGEEGGCVCHITYDLCDAVWSPALDAQSVWEYELTDLIKASNY